SDGFLCLRLGGATMKFLWCGCSETAGLAIIGQRKKKKGGYKREISLFKRTSFVVAYPSFRQKAASASL
ncbi:hypothetical protein ACXWOS_10310, partial [Streptococcus pyogenes]